MSRHQRMEAAKISKLVFLLMLANGAPVAVKDLLHRRLAYPLDAGVKLPDHHRLFGRSKTVRGIAASLFATSAGAAAVGLRWQTGLKISAVAMAGDLCSSFLKRRMDVPSSGKATGIDQVPESLLPLLAVQQELSLSAAEITAGVSAFVVSEMLFSILLYRMHLRDHPY